MIKRTYLKIFFLLILYALWTSFSFGADLTSSNFIIRDPVIGVGGGFYSSASFKLFGSQDPTNIGYSNSLNFLSGFGFLYYPFVESGILSGSAFGSTVNLSWTASSSARGFSVGGYSIGQSTVPGGPYTYTNVGNILNYNYTGQAIGTYYFVLQTLDVFNNVIITSPEININVISATGDGGGGGGVNTPTFPYLPGSNCKIADFDCSGKVNIKDLSILLFYLDKTGSVIEPYDLSLDGEIDLKDASIMFYYWDF